MKKIYLLLLAILPLLFTGCSNDDDTVLDVLEIVSSDIGFDAAGGEGSIALKTSGTAVNAVSDKSWLTITAATSSKVSYTVAESEEALQRSAKITITAGTMRRDVTILQKGALFDISLDDDIVFSALAEPYRIGYETSLTSVPEVLIPEDAKEWLSATAQDGEIILTAEPNLKDEIRNTVITISQAWKPVEIKVTQTGIELTPEKTSVVMYFAGDEQTLMVNSTLPFTAVVAEDGSWLTLQQNEASLTIKAPDNSGKPVRSTRITLSSGELTAAIDVTQRPPVYGDYLGNWNLTGEDAGTYNLNIVQDQAESTYKVTGWGKSIVATDSQYALTAYFDEETGFIFIPEQENLGTYNNQGTECPVVFYGKFLYGGSPTLYGGEEIVYLGLLMRDGSVQWLNGSFEFRGQEYDFLGGQYFLDTGGGRFASFNVDSPIMSNPKMTKAGATRSATRSSAVPDNRQDDILSKDIRRLENQDNRERTDAYGRILHDRLPDFLR